jgi:hypothetical protein
MANRPLLKAIDLTGLASAAAACAHGDNHRTEVKAPYDAATVGDTAFGRAGDPTRVKRVIRLTMTEAFRALVATQIPHPWPLQIPPP